MQPPGFGVRINVKVVKQPRREIVASRSFEETVDITTSSSIREIVDAFDESVGRVFKQIVVWTLSSAK